MNRYNDKEEVIETIEVGPILTTLCKDSAAYVGIRRGNSMNIEPIEKIKHFFVSMDAPADSNILDGIAHAHFLRMNLYYQDTSRKLRDTKDPTSINGRKASATRCEAVLNLWRISPGIVSSENADIVDIEMLTRANRKQRWIPRILPPVQRLLRRPRVTLNRHFPLRKVPTKGKAIPSQLLAQVPNQLQALIQSQ